MKSNNDNNKQQENKQKQNEVSPYSRGKDMNPTQNPDLNADEFTKSMKQQNRANNPEGRAQQSHPNNSPGHVND